MTFALWLLPFAMQAPVPKDAEAGVKWNLAKGDVFYVKVEEKGYGQNITRVVGKEGEHKQVVDESQDKFALKYEVLQAERDERVVKVSYLFADRWWKAPGWSGGNETERFKGASLTLHLNRRLELTKIEGYEAFKKQTEDRSFVTIGTQSDERGVAENMRFVFAVVPPFGDAVGAKCDHKLPLVFGVDRGGMTRTATATVSELSPAGVVTVSTVADYRWTGAGEGDTDFYRLLSTTNKAEKCQGKLVFDTKKGRMISFAEELKVVGVTKSKYVMNPTRETEIETTCRRVVTVTEVEPKEK